MSDSTVKSNSIATLGKVEGELRAGANATLIAADGKRITVTGGAYFEGPVTIRGAFECQSMIVEGRGFRPGGDVKVKGDLTVHGDADVTAHMEVEGEVKTRNLDVGGHFKSGSVTSKRLGVGGHMTTNGTLEAEAVDVGGHFTVSDSVKLASLNVRGHAKVGGGTIGGDVKVMGHFESTKKLDYGELKVLGQIRLPAGSRGQRLSIHGGSKFAGNTYCEDLNVTGVAKVEGSFTAKTVEVLGKFDLSGSLSVSKELRVLGSTDVKQRLECEGLLLGGKLSAERILVGGQAKLAGIMEADRGLKAKSIMVGKSSKVTGPLVGDEIDVGGEVDLDIGASDYFWSEKWLSGVRMTTVGDMYGKSVRIGPYSQAKRVFAEIIQMGEGSMADEVTYTSDLKLPKKYHLNKPPVKSAKLPDPPL